MRTLTLAVVAVVVMSTMVDAQTRERSRTRQLSGWTLAGVSVVGLLATEQDCQGIRFRGDRCLGEVEWPKGEIAAWSSGVVVGTLLATRWSWVERTGAEELVIAPTRRGIRASARWSW